MYLVWRGKGLGERLPREGTTSQGEKDQWEAEKRKRGPRRKLLWRKLLGEGSEV